jgi:hypothetical protein
MALVLADRVLETSTSEGLGTFALAGAQTGYQTFSSGIGNGNTCYYTINGQTTEQWEVGIGTVGAGTLARTTLISSNTGSFINFVAGVKNVFVTQPASKSIYKDASGNAIPLGSASATQLDITAQGNLRLQDTTGGEYVGIQAPATLAASYTLTMPTDDGTSGQALVTDGSGVLSWSTAASGDVYGPASATDNAIARFDLTTGKLIQNSVVTIADDGATVIAANSASDGLRITQIGAGNALVVEDSANPDATPFVIDANGNVIKGNNSAVLYASSVTPQIQLNIAGAATMGISRWSANTSNNALVFLKSRGATIGDFTSVASGDNLGAVNFYGTDGIEGILAAQILASVDGTPGASDMPGRLVFSTTADGASTPTERMRINNQGQMGYGTGAIAAGASIAIGRSVTGAATAYGILNNGPIQSDVTGNSYSYFTQFITQAATFTLINHRHFSATQGTIGAGSTVTNQFGFVADSSLTGATNNYGFYGNIASGTGRYNFYAAGTADNYFAGSVGIGSVPVAGTNFYLSKQITGSVSSFSMGNFGQIQSDVTTEARYFSTAPSTAAAAFTLADLRHYVAFQGTFGAGSTVTNQMAFYVGANLTGATNNYGFYGNIASGANRFNFYAAGTAANYFAGDMQFDKTVTAGGTTGAQTINKNAGTVNFAAAATSLVVTNSRVTTSSIIVCTVGTNDTTLKSVAAVAGAGSFTLHASAAATAETRVNFLIIN